LADWTGIANLACAGLGVRQLANVETDTSTAARTINALIPLLADEVIAAHPWKVAMVRAQLPAGLAPPLFGPAYLYPLPADPWCLRVWQVMDEEGSWLRYDDRDAGWQVEGRTILSDYAPPLAIKYIGRVTDPNLFTGQLATAMAFRIEAAAAYTLTNSREMEMTAMQKWASFIPDARSLDSQQGTPQHIRRSDILDSRW
jgi:hypothetical protein